MVQQDLCLSVLTCFFQLVHQLSLPPDSEQKNVCLHSGIQSQIEKEISESFFSPADSGSLYISWRHFSSSMLPAALCTFPDFTKRNEKKNFLSWNERINSSNSNSLALVRVALCIQMELKLESEWEIAEVFPFHTIIQKATFPNLTLVTVTLFLTLH